jgi:FlaG/FlaF family flagellin (archaellin)
MKKTNQYQKESLSPIVATIGLIAIIIFGIIADNLI